MEFINKIELCGIVGSVKITKIGNKEQARFSLCVDQVYTSSTGDVTIQNSWFDCTAWESSKITNLSKLAKGMIVHLTGRIKMSSYLNAEGNEKIYWEVICNTLEITEPDGKL